MLSCCLHAQNGTLVEKLPKVNSLDEEAAAVERKAEERRSQKALEEEKLGQLKLKWEEQAAQVAAKSAVRVEQPAYFIEFAVCLKANTLTQRDLVGSPRDMPGSADDEDPAHGRIGHHLDTGRMFVLCVCEEWHTRDPNSAVKYGDEIVAVNGRRGAADALIEAMRDYDEDLEVTFSRQVVIPMQLIKSGSLGVRFRKRIMLVVQSILPYGMISMYNANASINAQICPGDILSEVNGFSLNVIEEFEECQDGEEVRLVFKRPWPKKDLSRKFTRSLSKQSLF